MNTVDTQTPPYQILHDIVYDTTIIGHSPKYHGTCMMEGRRLENIAAMKINWIIAPDNGGEAVPKGGRVYVLKSKTLSVLCKDNIFVRSVSDGTTADTVGQRVTDIIGYAMNYDKNYVQPLPYDYNRILFFHRPVNIDSFDWQIVNLFTNLEPYNTSESLIEVGFNIEFYPVHVNNTFWQ